MTLSDEEFHGTTALVGSLNFFHFGTEQLGSVLWELRNNFVWLFVCLLYLLWIFRKDHNGWQRHRPCQGSSNGLASTCAHCSLRSHFRKLSKAKTNTNTKSDWPDMILVQNFTQPDFQAKSFTPQVFLQINSVNASNINDLGFFWL